MISQNVKNQSGMPKNGTHPVDKHVGTRVRAARTELGYSQEFVADRLGISFQQVQKYERGFNRISASRLYELAKIFRKPVAFFFQDIEEAEDGTLVQPESSKTYEQMDARHRRAVAEICRLDDDRMFEHFIGLARCVNAREEGAIASADCSKTTGSKNAGA